MDTLLEDTVMIRDQMLMKSVSRILQRSERQVDISKLIASYVDVGVLPQLQNMNNQIFYGRRGTGKTHVLKVLSSRLVESGNPLVVYIDARTLGSTSQFSDETIPLPTRCLALFRDILSPIYNSLLERIIENPPPRADEALNSADQLIEAITIPSKAYVEKEISEASTSTDRQMLEGAVSVGPQPRVDLKGGIGMEQKTEKKTVFGVTTQDKVIFPALHDALQKTLDLAETDLYILIDEWSSLPPDIQPFLAEFLKRGVLPVNRATVKIAALEYRSRFTIFSKETPIGFEVGADIATALDLDDYYVFDRNSDHLTTLYADMLLRHMEVDLPDHYMETTYRILTGDQLASRMFTERATFVELARAAEGVVRDLINIFTAAFFNAQRRGRDTIDRKAVLEASRQWFEQDKQTHLDDELQIALRRIVDEVIGTRKARSFLLPRELQRHPLIQRLFDARVLHQMQRGYADKDNPGVRYNIYTLDYGTYVDLLGTSKEPQVDLLFVSDGTEDRDLIVPYDDKRSIRRIVLTDAILNPVAASNKAIQPTRYTSG